MSALQATCPSCGAPITFKSGSSIVVICTYCRSAVARTDRALEDFGRVAELVETGSPLQLGLRGSWRDTNFELTGRAQMGHEAGGVWDEWYATFANGWVGWLAEAQGRFYLTFKQPVDANAIPSFENLQLGQPLNLMQGGPLVVAEKGRGKTLGAAGEIPYQLVPGESFNYADLSGAGSTFATLDYSDSPPVVYGGQEVTLTEIGLASAREPEREARTVSAATLSCPQCGGTLELRAPDQSERVTCPNCNSLLDINQGQLSYLRSLGKPSYPIYLPVGATAQFENTNLTIIGFMVRSVVVAGQQYFWGEYLLYNPQVGFRWLVHSDDQWSFVQAVPPGEVTESNGVVFRGKRFKIFQDAGTQVEHVAGEFYWKVEVGEKVWATDYVKPPLMLSKEVSRGQSQGSGEINWSLGTYVPYKEIEKLFNVELKAPSNVAPNQPFLQKAIYKYWGILLLILFFVAFITTAFGGSNHVMTQSFQFPALTNADATQVLFSEPFELKSRRNIVIEGTAAVSNSWMFVAGDFINEETGLVQTFELPIEYYFGVEDGESWSEGGQTKKTHISSLPAGKYTLRLESQWGDAWQQPANVSIKVDQGDAAGVNFIVAVIVLSIIPVFVLIWHISFERRRWSESMFGGGSDSDSDD
jgi:hypothetical protein